MAELWRKSSVGVLVALMTTFSRGALAAPQTQPTSPDEGAVRHAVDNYVAAFNHGNTDAIGAYYADKAEYTHADGKVLHGRQEIQQAVGQMMQQDKDAKLSVLKD